VWDAATLTYTSIAGIVGPIQDTTLAFSRPPPDTASDLAPLFPIKEGLVRRPTHGMLAMPKATHVSHLTLKALATSDMYSVLCLTPDDQAASSVAPALHPTS
jgi:hypothetical protein